MNRPNTLSSKWSIAAAIAGLIALAMVMFGPLSGQDARVLIAEAIDESKLVVLRGNTRPEARVRENDRGPVPDGFPMDHMLLQLKRPPVLESELEQYINQLTDKSSPNFRHWLTAQQQGEKYGPSQQDLDTVTGWLQGHGFTVDGIQPNRMVMDISGTAGQIRETFHTEIHYLEVNGETHFANMSDPRIPQALSPAVVGVVSMHNFRPHTMAMPRTDYTFSGCGSNCYALVPADFQTIYNLTPIYKRGILGQLQTIVVVEDSDTYSTDVATYRSTFLSKYSGTTTLVHPSGSSACSDPGATAAADSEADLDAEVAGATAPDATIEVASCADTTTTGVLLAIQNLVNAATPPAIMSISYGECEAANGATSNAAFNTAYQTGATAGVSIFASSGDNGPSGCASLFGTSVHWALPGVGITGWGESVYNVSVGGTDFEDLYNADKGGLPQSTYWSSSNSTSTDGSAKSYIPEIPWNDSCAGYLISNLEGYSAPYGSAGFCNSTTATNNNAYLSFGAAGGGPSGCATGGGGADQTGGAVVDGTCAGYAKPSWQAGIFGNPTDGVRDIPDVSLFASNGFWGHYVVVCWSDTTNGGAACTAGNPSVWSGFGGTSVSTPVMASIQALVNQKWSLTKVGNPNPTYYQIANTEFGASGNSACYSVNLPARRGLAPTCAFNDVTQGDSDVVCKYNGSYQSGCYAPSGTYGVLSSQPAALSITAPGSGYTSAPTCAIGGVSPYTTPYLSPTGGTIFSGGTAATCTAVHGQVNTLTVSSNPSSSTCTGKTIKVGSTTYTCELNVLPSAVNQFVGCGTSCGGSTAADEELTALSLVAVINNNPQLCPFTGCVFTGQTANSSATASIISTTGNATASNVVAVGAIADGGTFTFSTTTTWTSATTTGVANVTVSGLGGYAPGQPVTCTLTGGGFTTAATCKANQVPFVPPPGYAPAFFATPGWDFATGLGSVNATNLILNSAW